MRQKLAPFVRFPRGLSEPVRPRLPVLLRRPAGVVADAFLGGKRKRCGVPVSIARHDRLPVAKGMVLDFVAGQTLVSVGKRLELALTAFLALQIIAFLTDRPLADLAGSHRYLDEGRIYVQRLQLGRRTVVDAQSVRPLPETPQSDGSEFHNSIFARLRGFLFGNLEFRALR